MATNLDLGRLEQARAYRLRRLARRLRVHLLRTLEPLEVSPEQFFLLYRLHEQDGRFLRELADPVLDDRANLTRQAAAMEGRGWIVRRPDPADGRRKRVFLAPSGRALFEQLEPLIHETRGALFGGLDGADLVAFDRVLDHLEASL